MTPTTKTIGPIKYLSVDDHPSCNWTRFETETGFFILNPEEARDLHYAMSRIVAFLDTKK